MQVACCILQLLAFKFYHSRYQLESTVELSRVSRRRCVLGNGHQDGFISVTIWNVQELTVPSVF